MDDDGDAAAAAITPCIERKDGQIYREIEQKEGGYRERVNMGDTMRLNRKKRN